MIRRYADRDTECLFHREPVRRYPAQLHRAMLRKRRINEIVHGKWAVTADTALRLARYFGTSERFWLNLQARHDLEVERDRLGPRLETEVAVLARSAV